MRLPYLVSSFAIIFQEMCLQRKTAKRTNDLFIKSHQMRRFHRHTSFFITVQKQDCLFIDVVFRGGKWDHWSPYAEHVGHVDTREKSGLCKHFCAFNIPYSFIFFI